MDSGTHHYPLPHSLSLMNSPQFTRIYGMEAQRLHGFFLRMLGADLQLAADMVQEVMTRLWENRENVEGHPPETARPLIYAIAHNLCRDHWRRQAVRLEAADDEADHAMASLAVQPDAPLQLDRATFAEALRRVTAALPPDGRMLYALRYEQELPIADIATILRIPEGTVKSRLNALNHKLKQRLSAYVR